MRGIYSLGSGLNLIDNDLLHERVYGITGKEHISKLNDKEFKAQAERDRTDNTQSIAPNGYALV